MDNGLIFDIYRGTTHDGPGIRDTVFFQGCPLHCAWCHNPEGIPADAQPWWDKRNCIGCMLCCAACPTGANRPGKEGFQIDRSLCIRCGACAKSCPSGAMAMTSREWKLEDLLDEVLRDKPYYDRTGGGVTISGGECTMQSTLLKRLLQALHSKGVNTALDTCGFVAWNVLAELLPDVDYVLYDLKIFDEALHHRFTRQSNRLILENARRIAGMIQKRAWHGEFWIRTPLIPGASATEDNLAALGNFIVRELGNLPVRWELCAFNNSCITKYERLGKKWQYIGTPLLAAAEAERLRLHAVSCGVPNERVIVTGLLSE